MSKKKLFYYQVGTQKLFGKLYLPRENNGKGVIFCYPWGEERIRVHRVYENIAALLAQKGYTVLQFDYRGYGDSSGDFVETTIDTYLEDISSTITYFFKNTSVKTLGLLGLRFGATLVSLISEFDNRIDYQILWDPVIDVEKYIYEKLRVNIASQISAYRKVIMDRKKLIDKIMRGDPVDIEGYQLSKAFYCSVQNINLLNKKKAFLGKVLLIGISKPNQPLKVSEQLDRLHALYKASCEKADLAIVRAESFWELLKNYYPRAEDLYEKSLLWLDENVG